MAAALATVLGLVTGCTVGPSYHAPKVDREAQFKVPAVLTQQPAGAGPSPHEGGQPPDRWWETFNDPELDSLIDRALRQNRDLKAAVLRVRAAREQRIIASGSLLPQLDATAGYYRGRGSKNVKLPFGSGGPAGASSTSSGAATPKSTSAASGPGVHADAASPSAGAADGGGGTGVPPGGPASPLGEGGFPGVTTNLFQAGFDAVYEFDIFGGTRRALEAADAQAAAEVEGERGLRLTLAAEVASAYLQLRMAQSREAIARHSLADQRQSWKIAEDKFHAGLGNEAQAAQEGVQVHLIEAALPQIQTAEQSSRQSIAFLLGLDPTALDQELAPAAALPPLPTGLPLGVPSDLIRRRPDIRRAERQLQAASAQVGVATAQLFPQFSITGAFGQDSSLLKQLPYWGSHYYSIAPGVRWPILNWAQLHASIRIQNDLEAQALLAYESAVSQALKDVQDALVNYLSERQRHAALTQAVAEAGRAHRVARQTYDAGLADQLQALEADRALLQAQDSLTQSDAALRLDLVALYKALGGGWEQPANKL